MLNKIFCNALMKGAHKRIGQSRGKGRAAKCWWTNEVAEAVKTRIDARKKAAKCGVREDVSAWRRAERACTKLIRSQKARTWREFMSYIDQDTDLGRVRNSLSGQRSAPRKIPPLFEKSTTPDGLDETTVLTKDTDKAEAFARGYAAS